MSRRIEVIAPAVGETVVKVGVHHHLEIVRVMPVSIAEFLNVQNGYIGVELGEHGEDGAVAFEECIDGMLGMTGIELFRAQLPVPTRCCRKPPTTTRGEEGACP